ncbi:MAG TPA: D-alanine--D-alanine ligase [Nitrospiria bacterium]|nr:D-alanine--D-alanine ligase [Nitrospiria bacterium]
MVTNKKIAVLMGGKSAEREISLKSGRAMEASLRRQGCTVVAIDLNETVAERLRQEKIELAVNALHGRGGEDGSIQGLLEILGIPYTGSGVLASAIGMNKGMTKRLLQADGVPTPKYSVLRSTRLSTDDFKEIPAGLDCPVVVKPSSEGSTIGVTIVRDRGSVESAYREAFRHGEEILVEEYIEGHEVTAGILDETPLPLIEIVPKGAFYDYEAKYTKEMTDYIVPGRFPSEVTREVQALALKTHRIIGCRGCSRVDFRVDRSGRPFVLEINTVPGMTETSLLPKAAAAAGIAYDQLVAKIVQSALHSTIER